MTYFVDKGSIVREIWGKADTILVIFAGAAAEFAVHKAVDWLYFTGRLPADPLGRLFSTVTYARQIVFSEKQDALATIDRISAIHGQIEQQREMAIPDWAYRGVIFMLIDYSIRSYELLERKLSEEEKAEVFDVFNRVGKRMHINGLPDTYQDWMLQREAQLQADMAMSHYSTDLFKQYKKHLGSFRFYLLKELQILVLPDRLRQLLSFNQFSILQPVIPFYKFLELFKMDWLLKSLLLPKSYHQQIKQLDSKIE